jgi:hypothetical protein
VLDVFRMFLMLSDVFRVIGNGVSVFLYVEKLSSCKVRLLDRVIGLYIFRIAKCLKHSKNEDPLIDSNRFSGLFPVVLRS